MCVSSSQGDSTISKTHFFTSSTRRLFWPLAGLLATAWIMVGAAPAPQVPVLETERSVYLGASDRIVLVPGPTGFELWISTPEGTWSRSFDRNARAMGSLRPTADQVPAAKATAEWGDGRRVRIEETWRGDGRGWDLLSHLTDSDGNRYSPLLVNAHLPGDQLSPAVATRPDGGFVVVWQSHGQDGDGWGIYARQFAPEGEAGREVRLNDETIGDQLEPTILSLGSDWVVAWRSLRDGTEGEVFLRWLGDLIFADDFESGDLSAWTAATGAPLVPAFDTDPGIGFAPLTVRFDASSSSDPDGSITRWSWDFGDRTTDAGPEVAHTYAEPGQYTVTLTIMGSDGETATTTRGIDVLPPAALLATALVTVRNDVTPGGALGRATTPIVTLRNDTASAFPDGQATTAVVTVRNDSPPAFPAGQAATATVTVRNDALPPISSGRSEAALVSIRNDGNP